MVTLPSNELIKDMYTEFGLTYYFSEVLCQGLGIFYALMSFKNINDATRPRLEEKLVEAQSLTLGVVIGKVKPLISISLQTKLDQALEKRNYLAHQFWYEHAYDMAVASGVIKLIAELRQNRELFEKLDNKILELTTQRLKQIGLTEGTIEEYLQRGLAGEIEDPLPLKVPLSKKMVRIIEVYDIVLDNESIALVVRQQSSSRYHRVEVGKLGAGLGDIEHPTDGGALGVACRRPRGYLSTERLHVGDTPFETLVNQYRQLDLDHVQP